MAHCFYDNIGSAVLSCCQDCLRRILLQIELSCPVLLSSLEARWIRVHCVDILCAISAGDDCRKETDLLSNFSGTEAYRSTADYHNRILLELLCRQVFERASRCVPSLVRPLIETNEYPVGNISAIKMDNSGFNCGGIGNKVPSASGTMTISACPPSNLSEPNSRHFSHREVNPREQ